MEHWRGQGLLPTPTPGLRMHASHAPSPGLLPAPMLPVRHRALLKRPYHRHLHKPYAPLLRAPMQRPPRMITKPGAKPCFQREIRIDKYEDDRFQEHILENSEIKSDEVKPSHSCHAADMEEAYRLHREKLSKSIHERKVKLGSASTEVNNNSHVSQSPEVKPPFEESSSSEKTGPAKDLSCLATYLRRMKDSSNVSYEDQVSDDQTNSDKMDLNIICSTPPRLEEQVLYKDVTTSSDKNIHKNELCGDDDLNQNSVNLSPTSKNKKHKIQLSSYANGSTHSSGDESTIKRRRLQDDENVNRLSFEDKTKVSSSPRNSLVSNSDDNTICENIGLTGDFSEAAIKDIHKTHSVGKPFVSLTSNESVHEVLNPEELGQAFISIDEENWNKLSSCACQSHCQHQVVEIKSLKDFEKYPCKNGDKISQKNVKIDETPTSPTCDKYEIHQMSSHKETNDDCKDKIHNGSKIKKAEDLPCIIPVAGYYCDVCCDFFFDEASTFQHCETAQHCHKVEEISKHKPEDSIKTGNYEVNYDVHSKKDMQRNNKRRRRKTSWKGNVIEDDDNAKVAENLCETNSSGVKNIPRAANALDDSPPRRLSTTRKSSIYSTKPFDWNFVIPKRK